MVADRVRVRDPAEDADYGNPAEDTEYGLGPVHFYSTVLQLTTRA
jgi:hypothetical protein